MRKDNTAITDTVAYQTKIMKGKEKKFFISTVIMWGLAIISRVVTSYLYLPYVFIFIQDLIYLIFINDYFKYDCYPVSEKKDKFYCEDLMNLSVLLNTWAAYNAFKFIYQLGEKI